MHSHSIESWTHSHVFLGAQHDRNERRTWFVVALTTVMMFTEVIGGYLFGSMALVADGWHMSTHAAALTIAALAYRFARAHAHDIRFSFGTGKLGELAAYTSAIILAMIALDIGVQSVGRLFNPVAIAFNEALPIAVLGLTVNLASAWLLSGGHGHDHAHEHDDDDYDDHADHHDFNFRAAYIHVLADTFTSVLAIASLLLVRFYGIAWMDPITGLIGAAVIVSWAWSLVRSAGAVLLDLVPDPKLAGAIRNRLEVSGDRVADLHLWRLGPGHSGMIATVVSEAPLAPEVYKQRLEGIRTLSHVTIEVVRCPEH